MELLHKFDPEKYEQPVVRTFVGRELKDSLEEVDYLQESHLRIWYNTQEDAYAMHHHPAVEVILCVEQPYKVTVTNQSFTLHPGDILVIPPHLLHSMEGSKGARFIGLFNIDMLNVFSDFKILAPTFLTPHLLNPDRTPETYDFVYRTFIKIIDYYFSNEIMWEFSIYSKILELLTLIGQYRYGATLHDSKLDKSASENYEKFATLLTYIDSHYANEITLEQAAALVGFSKFHFSRLFKEFTNCTFYDYLSQTRIQAAKRLLSTGTSITDIAFQTGFNSLTSFCRCFKKYTDLSPSEYRDLYEKS